ncbi:hypothetical protein DEO72_LG1g2436 [Vigna unguiculata]|uniref:Uncharacterized protein n=1 Tax=Vigna unguiculata TaxID=3917 RepID=A0A4D6KQ58_VIGUN|nr:hypothetical protein DEO72_LG1g2436 [Vigna unguiculata]
MFAFCSLRRRALILSDALSRSGESDSLKRVLEETWCSWLAFSSRRGICVLGEGRSHPGEMGPLRRGLVECSMCYCFKSRSGENA